jgi:DNA-binding CsgD family transcriptional regulator
METFVGREAELTELHDAAARARAGQSAVVVVEGEAGMGKSTLLNHFVAELADVIVVRASGDDGEQNLSFGLIGQLVNSAQSAGAPPFPSSWLDGDRDPLAAGAALLRLLAEPGERPDAVILAVDDLHFADRPSARALLFTLRRMEVDRVLTVVTVRPGRWAELGEGWARFVAGDHRVARVRLGGLSVDDVAALAVAVGGHLPRRAAARLVSYTDGNPFYCRALLDETGPGRPPVPGELAVPAALARSVGGRLDTLEPQVRALVRCAAVLGVRCEVLQAAQLAGIGAPLAAVEQAVRAGLLTVGTGPGPAQIAFPHPLARQAVYDHLGAEERRLLHQQAAVLVRGEASLAHQVAAAEGLDDEIAQSLELAARQAERRGRPLMAARWLADASALSADRADSDRLLFDAVELLLSCGEAAEAQELMERLGRCGPCPRRSQLIGQLDLLAGRPVEAEANLTEAWDCHDPIKEPAVGAEAAYQLAMLHSVGGHLIEGIEWARRSSASVGVRPALQQRAAGLLAVGLAVNGRPDEALHQLRFLPAAPTEIPEKESDALVYRGVTRAVLEDLAGAADDLATAAARLQRGSALQLVSPCLSYLAETEYRLGRWDDAVGHAELSVSLAHDTDRVFDFAFAHSFAAAVPAARGDWDVAGAHVGAAQEAVRRSGGAEAVAAASTAAARLAFARGDPAAVIAAAGAVRATGKASDLGHPARYDWRVLEAEALLDAGRTDDARQALDELDAVARLAGIASAAVEVSRLRGVLATRLGQDTRAAAAFADAWNRAVQVQVPMTLALLGLCDAQRLRRSRGRRRQAVARLREARQILAGLGAEPFVRRCDRELEACGIAPAPSRPAVPVRLTPSEVAVANLVAKGGSNREVAAELFLSVKTVEFHLANVYTKLGIRSRQDLIALRHLAAADS